ncbi:glycosyltransferase family 4 protein [Nitratidesulfovibrio vulgaris]|uniref:Glycosyl transferase, group 1 n=1 Tax=Nitratidesulfovibrio vulgaris (strain DP4) TaxID=391774 RepID=A0A0H3ABQ3_NITV4|nr:glycosyltransferase family 4 protein [Nitratidesulfovibrio vulgaris]ABM29137.1 glycosyl transferase, group 1 [Nitratidesulfovibrio vulgaris DP4]GEB81308.1 glycosyl transferase [Desulfovibrio desulfuricans]
MKGQTSPRLVLHIAPSMGCGGTEKVLQSLACHMDATRYTCAVWSPQDGPRSAMLREAGVVVHIGGDPGMWARRLKADIVHIHRGGWPTPALLRALRAACRTTQAGLTLPRFIETNVFGRHDPSAAARCIDRTLFVSHFCARRYAAVHGIPATPPRYDVLYNPVDTGVFIKGTPPPAARDYSRPVIGRLSRPDPGKWSRLALDFLPLLRGELHDFRYLVVGGIPEAESFVSDHGLGEHVRFMPPLLDDKELAAFYGRLSVFAHANDTGESFGLAIAEAMSAALPVVTHPCPELRDNAQLELVQHGVTGIVAGNAEEYAAAILWLLRNPAVARRMGEAGRQKAVELFDIRRIAQRAADIYDDVLAHAGRNIPEG